MHETLFLETDDPGRSLTIRDGVIAAIGESAPPDARTIRCGDATIRPGAVNAHTHLYSGLAPLDMPAPQPEPTNFVEILERVWWRLDRALDADSLRASARLYVAEALLAGTTSLIDHHESPHLIAGSLDVLADACTELGVRALLCYGATERNGGRKEADAGLDECRRFIAVNRQHTQRGLVGLHASFTVSDATIQRAAELCRELDTVLHIHVAEDGADVEDARARGYAGPLERLVDLDALVPGSIFAHGVHLDRAQVERAAAAGCWLVQNPRSNAGNRVGHPKHLAASDRVALGTDGYPANMQAEEAALIELAEATGSPGEADSRSLRLGNGARLLSERFSIPISSTIEVGAAADLVVATGTPRWVVVGGRLVVDDAVLVGADIDAIRADARRAARLLWRAMARI